MKPTLMIAAVTFVALTTPTLAAPPITTETVNITNLSTQNVGAAALLRTAQSASFRVNTTMLESGNAYTIWVAAFNKPEYCIDECDGSDITAADGSIFFGSAFVTGEGGAANVEFGVQANALPSGTFIASGHSKGINSGNGFNVELHLIIADHGPTSEVDDFATALSTPGPGVQFATFK